VGNLIYSYLHLLRPNGEELGVYGMDVPPEKLVAPGTRVQFTAEFNERPIFASLPDLLWRATTCTKLG